MKKLKWIIVVALFFVGLVAFAQTDSVVGKITGLRPFNGEYAVTVENTTFVLIKKLNTKTETSIDINPEYKDILIKRKGKYEINPKYANKVFKITYYVNGKGWKCIKKMEPSK